MGDNNTTNSLEKMLDAPLSTSRDDKDVPPRTKRRPEREHGGGGYDGARSPKRHHNNNNNRGGNGGGRDHHHSSSSQYHQQQRRGGGQPHHQHQRGPPRDRAPPPRKRRSDETYFKYRWTLSADNVQILTVIAFGGDFITVSSNGNLRLDAQGGRSFSHFQAMNMILRPLQLKLVADEQSEEDQQDGESNAPRSGAYKGGKWKVAHVKHGWSQEFVDGMKLSAFPNRDWKRIYPKLKSFPQSVVFSSETENI